ncbi:MAG: SUMF1/EgtB/PvdO family nonheme iron enzyme [Verrucomicrobiota bacterium]
MKKTHSFFIFVLSLLSIVLTSRVAANNIQVSNVELKNLNDPSNWVHVEFDLTWENSWRVSSGPSNWDAAWVFIKYRVNGGNWTHGIVSQSSSVAAAGSILDVTSDGTGAFIHRDADGSGNISFSNTQLRWNFGSTDISDIIDIKVFAIEMVYIPEGSFYLGGTSGSEVNKFYSGGFSTGSSYQVTSENALTIANTSGNLYYVNDNAGSGDQTGTLGASFPKGFNDFYCMKYEVSEAQWIGFFNCLTPTQKTNRDITDSAHKNSDAVVDRNTIAWTSGEASTSAPDRAVSFLSTGDMNAYMDWVGLRPMTELEFEKASRGPILPKSGEFAWGNNLVSLSPYTLSNSGSPLEGVTNPSETAGNASYSTSDGTINGPLRCGIFAASAVNKSRTETGGSFYGVMEMSGNLIERCVSVGTAQGRNFTGVHGNGIISSTGNGTAINWPVNNTGNGYGYRGGSWFNSSDFMRISDRFDAATVFSTGTDRVGFRCVRTAP